jgi:hypothetical protein
VRQQQVTAVASVEQGNGESFLQPERLMRRQGIWLGASWPRVASYVNLQPSLRLNDAHFTQYVSKAASHILAYVESSMVHGITRSCRAVT